MGVPITEEEEHSGEQATSPSRLAPELSNMMNHESDMGFIELPRKKKIFSSSSFYEEPNAIYPTMEEQVEMCRKIADSLSDDCNKKSKGANMFFKRVRKAENWIVPSFDGHEIQTFENADPASMPYVKINKEPPKLKLILDPRHIIDLKQLQSEGIQIVEQSAVTKNLCQNIVNDLNSPTGKGAQLFAKRKKKSMDWVVDEDKVREHVKQVQDREMGIFTPEPPLMTNFIRPDEVAETVIRAAETKIMSYPAPRKFAIEPVHYYAEPAMSVPTPLPSLEPVLEPEPQNSILDSQQSTMFSPVKASIYSCRAPRGWASPTPPRPVSMLENKSFEPDTSIQLTPVQPQTTSMLPQSNPVTRTYSFSNFNITPKAWIPMASDPLTQVRKVRPPSLIVQ